MSRKPLNIFTRLLNNIVVNQQTDCWEWQGATNNIGYGFIRDGKKMRTTHKVSYELHNNTIVPKNMCVCHTCDNMLCINPDHLWLGTRTDNTHDMMKKGRHNFFGGKSVKGLKHPRHVCKYCNNSYALNMLNRYHNENCKHKPIV